jgi:uncharacterized protein YjcR
MKFKVLKQKKVNSTNVEELYARWVAGETLQQIATSLGCSPCQLSTGFQSYGFKQPPHVQKSPQHTRTGKLITNKLLASVKK